MTNSGPIDPEVYRAAGKLWPRAASLALSALGDAEAGLRLMIKAVSVVSRQSQQGKREIHELKGFLFTTFKRLVLAELRKKEKRQELDAELLALRSDRADRG